MPRNIFNSKPKKTSQMKLNGRWAMISFFDNYLDYGPKENSMPILLRLFLEKKRGKKIAKVLAF